MTGLQQPASQRLDPVIAEKYERGLRRFKWTLGFAFVLVIAGPILTDIDAIQILSFVVPALLILWAFWAFRCPSCGKRLGRSVRRYCDECGTRLRYSVLFCACPTRACRRRSIKSRIEVGLVSGSGVVW